jgi:hypothetical protein
MAQRKAYEPEALEVEEISVEDEKYLSAATLARLKELTFEGEAKEEGEAEPVVAVRAEESVEETAAEIGAELGEQPGELAQEVAEEPVALGMVSAEDEEEGEEE